MKILIIGIALLFLAFITSAISDVGQACNATYECKVGFCEKGKCSFPTLNSYDTYGNCNITQDCSSGYCNRQGQCIIPKPPAPTGITILPSIKSGCSGLMEETKDFGSLAVCSLFWLLVPAFSIIAGLAGRNEKLKLIPIIAFLLPMLIALFLTPFFGLIAAILETVFLVSRNSKRTFFL